MKNLFKYDFLDKNKGIQSAIFVILFCIFIAIPKHSTPFIIALGIVWVIFLYSLYAFFDKWLVGQNFSDNQLSLFNKIGWVIYIVGFMVGFCLILWQD